MAKPTPLHGCDLPSRARELVEKYRLGSKDTTIEDEGVFAGDLGYVEHCAHEIAHSMLLKIGLVRCLSKTVGDVLSKKPHVIQVWHEAAAWSVEWHALRNLSIERIEWGDVVAGAEVQNVPTDLLLELVEQTWTRQMGAVLASFIGGTTDSIGCGAVHDRVESALREYVRKQCES